MIRALAAILALAFSVAPVSAQTPSKFTQCQIYDTTVITTGGPPAVSHCNILQGTYATVWLSATAEVSCPQRNPAQNDAAMFFAAGAGTQPTPGTAITNMAKFVGGISGGVLTVTSMVTPYSGTSSDFVIDAINASNSTLHDNVYDNGAFIPSSASGQTLKITGQTSSAEPGSTLGGRGQYTVSDNTVTVSPGTTMWSMYTTFAGTPRPPSTVQATGKGPLELLACATGKTYITTVTGGIDYNRFTTSPTQSVWAVLVVYTEKQPCCNPGPSNWNNGLMTFFAPAPTVAVTGGIGGIVQ